MAAGRQQEVVGADPSESIPQEKSKKLPDREETDLCSRFKLMATNPKQPRLVHMAPIQQQRSSTLLPIAKFEELPAVPLDRILKCLDAEDLRRLHQTSKAWKNIVISRPLANTRRVELVEQIRSNKENVPGGDTTVPQHVVASTPLIKSTPVTSLNDGKPGSRMMLGQITNTGTEQSRRVTRSVLNTPTSRFLQEFEVGKKLMKGQQLFRCPECRSPVPSPASTPVARKEVKNLSSTGANYLAAVEKLQTADSPVSTADSGYQSRSNLSLTNSDQLYEQNNNSVFEEEEEEDSSEEFSMSVLATPESSIQVTPGFSRNNMSLGKTGTASKGFRLCVNQEFFSPNPPVSLQTADTVECPTCSYKFCCKCQCTMHPGKPCFVIDSESLSTPSPIQSMQDSTVSRSRQKSANKSALRRLARL